MKEFDPVHAAVHGYTRDDWEAVESPELTDEDLAKARPLKEAMPDLHEALVEEIGRRNAPPSETTVLIRIDDDVAEKFRKTGEGWEARLNDVLRRAEV